MKFTNILVCLGFGFAKFVAAQDVIPPTNTIELFNGTNFDRFTFCTRNGADPMHT